MKIQQENIRENSKIHEIREHFLSWTIPVIRYPVNLVWSMVHAVTTYDSYHSGSCKFIKSDVNAVQLPLTLVTTQSHAHLLSICIKG